MAKSATVKAWFDYNTYMANKLIQMQKAEPSAGWTADSLKAAFEKAGYYGDTGAQAHFNSWGHTEDVSPNKLFDATYYYQAKAIAYYTSSEAGSAQVTKAEVLKDLANYGSKMEAIIKGAGMDAWTHYIKWGTKEGINPSNNFDTSDYMQAKIDAMGGSMTADEVYAAFKKAGFNALSHEQTYAGKGGANEVTSTSFPVPESEQFTPAEEGDVTNDIAFTSTIGEALTGTLGNDVVTGVIGANLNSSTFQNGDSLSDSSTTDEDVLNLSVVADGYDPVVPVKNIETINIESRLAAGGDHTFDASEVTGTNEINVNVKNGAVLDDDGAVVTNAPVETVDSVQDLATIVSLSGKGDLNVNYKDSLLTGTSDSVTVGLKGSTGDLSVNAAKGGIETLVVSTTGTNNSDISVGANVGKSNSIATYTIKGDGVNTISFNRGSDDKGKATAITVDASAIKSASQSYTIDGVMTGDKLTGGAGTDDAIAFTGVKGAKAQTPEVAAFEKASFQMSGNAKLDASKISDVKELTFSQTADNTDATVTGLASTITTLNLLAATKDDKDDGVAHDLGVYSFTYAKDTTSAVAVNVGCAASDGAETDFALEVKGTTGEVTVNFNDEADHVLQSVETGASSSLVLNAGEGDVTLLDLPGGTNNKTLTSLTVNAEDSAVVIGYDADTDTPVAIGATALSNVVVTGGAASEFTLTLGAGTSEVTVDASEFGGNFTFDASANTKAVDVDASGTGAKSLVNILGTAEDDTITVGKCASPNAGDSSVDAGGGVDTITLKGAAALTITETQGETVDGALAVAENVVTANCDVIDLSEFKGNGLTLNLKTTAAMTGVDALDDSGTIADLGVTATKVKAYLGNFDNGSFEAATDGGDVLLLFAGDGTAATADNAVVLAGVSSLDDINFDYVAG